MLRWLTAGESHGPALLATIEGLPAGIEVTTVDVAAALELILGEPGHRREVADRGDYLDLGGMWLPRLEGLELRLEVDQQDEVEFLGGVRHGRTLGSPVAIRVANSEWPKWQTVMSADPVTDEAYAAADDVNAEKEIARNRALTRPRPGHADLVGMQKYAFDAWWTGWPFGHDPARSSSAPPPARPLRASPSARSLPASSSRPTASGSSRTPCRSAPPLSPTMRPFRTPTR